MRLLPGGAIAAAVLCFPSAASAQGRRFPPLDVAAYLNPVSFGGAGARSDLGLAFHVRPIPWIRVGLRGTYGWENQIFEDQGEQTVAYRTIDLLAHAEVHTRPRPDIVVDPWLGVGVGTMIGWQGPSEPGNASSGYSPIVGADAPKSDCRTDLRCTFGLLVADVGVDFRAASWFAVGIYVTGRVPLGRLVRNDDPQISYRGFAPNTASVFFLLPSLRLLFDF